MAAGRLNLDSLHHAIEPRARAILLVNPNNPTGSFVRQDELDAVRETAARHELAIISDEVFDLYPLEQLEPGRSGALVEERDALTFTLGGLSKSAALPQVKLGWILVGGPEALVRRALARLELVCDSYLSVATPVQLAVGTLLERTVPVADQIRRRVWTNYATLRRLVRAVPRVRRPPCRGGVVRCSPGAGNPLWRRRWSST